MVIGVVSEYPSNWRIFCIISYNLYFIKQFAYNAKTLININLKMSGADRRRFLKQAKDLVRPGRPVEDLHAELVKVQQRREAWRTHDPDGGWPRLPQGLDTMQATAIQARDAVEDLEPILGAGSGAPELMDLPLEDLLARVRALADDDATAQKMPELNRVVADLDELGLTAFVADLAERRVADDDLDTELAYC